MSEICCKGTGEPETRCEYDEALIDWMKMNVCDSCNVTSSEKNPVATYTATFERTGKKITLCRKCLEELLIVTKNVLETEDSHGE